MKNFIKLFIACAFLVSCGDFEETIYDGVGGATLAFFDASSSSLEVEINQTNTTTVTIGVSTLSSVERTVAVSADAASTADAAMYSFSSTVTIPANEYFGTLTVTGIDAGLTTDSRSLILNIDDSPGITGSTDSHTVTLVEVCPIPADYMIGDYQIADGVAVIGPGNGTSNFDPGVVTLTASSASSRSFTNAVLPAFRGPITVTVSLVCGKLILADTDPSIACADPDIAYILGTAGDNNSDYDLSSDQTFTIFYTEDPNASCGGPYLLSSFTLTKI
ncbi:hypothetical protein [uncultured Kordia sp.]|uniref:hypothetical protein n=1 Tax=uncultured Kordia sp. TaxID=507699 RepID=UPI00262A4FF8|nr:hypothetical protein [uncultured Kordia sp.]